MLEQLQNLVALWQSQPRAVELWLSPLLNVTQKQALAQALVTDKATLEFLHVMATQGRLNILPAVVTVFESMVLEAEGQMKIQLQCAQDLSTSEKMAWGAQLQKYFGKVIVLETETFPALLGGVRVLSAEGVLDLSVRGKTQALRQFLLKQN